MNKIAEFALIDKYFKPLATNSKASQGLRDDVARISLEKDEELIISKDLIFEDVHFLLKDGAAKIAAKLMLSNLSDIASSGSTPKYYMLGFSKNDKLSENFYKEFCDELKKIQKKYKISLIGGDTIKSSEKLFFSLTIFGISKKNKVLARKNAKDKDLIFVSGSIGDAYLGLLSKTRPEIIFNKKNEKYFLDRHFSPSPRISLGQELVKQNLSKCAIDISDGLLADLNQICKESLLEAVIYKDKIPFSKQASEVIEQINFRNLISGGDDYELIFTAKKENKNKILQLAKKLKIELNHIGFLKKTNSVKITILDNKNREIKFEKYGYQH